MHSIMGNLIAILEMSPSPIAVTCRKFICDVTNILLLRRSGNTSNFAAVRTQLLKLEIEFKSEIYKIQVF